jgi:hypothetical protein
VCEISGTRDGQRGRDGEEEGVKGKGINFDGWMDRLGRVG